MSGKAIDVAHLVRQREWSRATFGPGDRRKGVLDHIRKELVEIEEAGERTDEWFDVVILALDGAWRDGYEPAEIIAAIKAKQAKNERRTWPDWRTADPDRAIEHVRTPAAGRGDTDDSGELPRVVTKEPPIGSVVWVHGKFASGGGWSSPYTMRHPEGWKRSPWSEAITWERLTDPHDGVATVELVALASPAARPAESPGELREAVVETLHAQGCREDGDGSGCGGHCVDDADALLSGPLAPLLAAEATVKRVEALAKEWENFGTRYTLTAGLAAEELRRALDGPQ